MRIRCFCAALIMFIAPSQGLSDQTAERAMPPASPLSDQDKGSELSDQVSRLMVKCANQLTAQDPLSLETCKQQRDLADQYPPHERLADRMMAHDEYGIALAAFDRKQEALAEFNEEVSLAPKAVKPDAAGWSTALWHRAMIYNQLGDVQKADRDYRAAEANLRQNPFDASGQSTAKKRRTILRQHAAMLKKEGRIQDAQRLVDEAAKM